MIIQNIPSKFLSIAENYPSKFGFSDDSRFIYISRPNQIILVYDNKFNEYVYFLPPKKYVIFNKSLFRTLQADPTVIRYMKTIKGFRMDVNVPYIYALNQNILIILFDHESFAPIDNGYSALIMLIRLDFSAKNFSMIDKIIYKDCYYSYLLKDCSQFALLHISLPDEPMDEGNECRCFLYEINEKGIHQTKKDPLIFDYNFLSSWYMPIKLHLHDNKIWFFRDTEPVQIRRPGGRQQIPESEDMEQLSYFDLNDEIPIKETTVEILNKTGESYYSGGFLIYFPNQFEYEMLNLHTKCWSNGRNNNLLQKFKLIDANLIEFSTQRSKHASYHVDLQFNVLAIDKVTKELFLVPLKNPQSLYDIAWTAALNAGLLNQKDESKLPKNLKYQKIF